MSAAPAHSPLNKAPDTQNGQRKHPQTDKEATGLFSVVAIRICKPLQIGRIRLLWIDEDAALNEILAGSDNFFGCSHSAPQRVFDH
jgi:hypothetical protein